MKASNFIAKFLENRGVTHCYELVGGMITHLLDSISKETKIKIISCHHEQSAGFAAEAHARITGVPGVALATSGPGATNLLTAIASCYFDSTPAIFITGQVNTYEQRKKNGPRQLGFQETNITEMSASITKKSFNVDDVKKIPEIMEQAFMYALSGRKGPCLIDIPMNIQSQEIEDDLAKKFFIKDKKLINSNKYFKQTIFNDAEINKLIKDINTASKPLILLGGGCASIENRAYAKNIVNLLKIPTVLSLMGVDLLPVSNKLRVGFIGSYGNRWANKALGECDLLIVIGSRLDIKQTGSNIKSFTQGKKIWQFDIDIAEIGTRIKPTKSFLIEIPILSNLLSEFFNRKKILLNSKEKHINWIQEIDKWRLKYPAEREYKTMKSEINPLRFLYLLSEQIYNDTIYITDVGQHQMWAAQNLQFGDCDRFITSGGAGAMGFGLPASIGCAFASKKKNIILITGDGSFQLNIQEIETLKRNALNIKIVLFNNNCHGMVRQFQESYFSNNLQSTVKGYSAPNFSKLAKSYGITSLKIKDNIEEVNSIKKLIDSEGPSLLEILISSESKVYPKLAFGRKFGEMEPDVSPKAMEST